ncbi:type III pantothenate kinase [Parazoarcus communis]|uniref:Type III pantothenate kinase n=1 Tax=Parazoarcus communis TaxID=41977 RepID=A0A2U8GQR2_9RHOO|nr:type III pantothenate kinase [Parazoarcus communis]AWI76039.1 type III pantothenate kinase [Parazoarcus communis]
MILLIDAGNTRIKWRLHGTPTPVEGACEHDQLEALDAVLAETPGIRRMIGANVAGPGVGGQIGTLAAQRGMTPEWITPDAERCGVRNLYRQPAQLGADRWAALIGARSQHPHACLVVMAGTATTIDLLDAAGDFLGGLILPGVALMQRALASNTAQLPLASGQFSPTPRSTADAILSGCLQAQAGAVERMFRQIESSAGACCLLGGGAADAFASLLSLPVQRVDNLVLDGLARIAQDS